MNLQDELNLVISGFKALSTVRLTLFSDPTPLGAAQADSDGVVRLTVRLPAVTGGVHLVQLEGEAANGAALTQEVRVEVPGRPVGGYTTYLCCFGAEPETISPDAPIERVEVTLAGQYLTTLLPDERGGVLVVVPSVDRLFDPTNPTLAARSLVTGAVVSKVIDPIPTVTSLWALSTTEQAITVAGSGFAADGLLHSEGGVVVTGPGSTLRGGVEYVSSVVVASPAVAPVTSQVAPGQGRPTAANLADYRPGGAVARTTRSYRAIDPSMCEGGVWRPASPQELTGVVYVPCAVDIAAGGHTIVATIAAEGQIRISGPSFVLGRDQAGAPSLISGSARPDAIVLAAADSTIKGTVVALAGGVRVSGPRTVLLCGVVADTIAVAQAGVSAPITGRCRT